MECGGVRTTAIRVRIRAYLADTCGEMVPVNLNQRMGLTAGDIATVGAAAGVIMAEADPW
jgi:hypothetical protein